MARSKPRKKLRRDKLVDLFEARPVTSPEELAKEDELLSSPVKPTGGQSPALSIDLEVTIPDSPKEDRIPTPPFFKVLFGEEAGKRLQECVTYSKSFKIPKVKPTSTVASLGHSTTVQQHPRIIFDLPSDAQDSVTPKIGPTDSANATANNSLNTPSVFDRLDVPNQLQPIKKSTVQPSIKVSRCKKRSEKTFKKRERWCTENGYSELLKLAVVTPTGRDVTIFNREFDKVQRECEKQWHNRRLSDAIKDGLFIAPPKQSKSTHINRKKDERKLQSSNRSSHSNRRKDERQVQSNNRSARSHQSASTVGTPSTYREHRRRKPPAVPAKGHSAVTGHSQTPNRNSRQSSVTPSVGEHARKSESKPIRIKRQPGTFERNKISLATYQSRKNN